MKQKTLSPRLRRLRADACAAKRRNPGWNVWVDSGGHVNATTTRSLTGGSGTTLDAETLPALEDKIAAFNRLDSAA